MRRSVAVTAMVLAALGAFSASAADWKFINGNVYQMGQPENWMCGPTTIAMWAGALKRMSYNPYSIANTYSAKDGTNVPEFMAAQQRFSPTGYYFAEWEYVDRRAGIKHLMRNVATYREPVAFVARPLGSHWMLIRGGRADQDPTNYPKASIKGLYVNDSTEKSPVYSTPVTGMYSHLEYGPSTVALQWWMIGAWNDKKYRAVLRTCCIVSQGKTFENPDSFWTY